ncbi:MAG TPA: hypothetical protein PKX93_00550 [bacterium]|nr:hypothetical protein [bacterium]HOL65931.1 hypothetical protein [bacterium]
METAIIIKPHHFVDIISSLGSRKLSLEPHPYGHAVAKVTALILTSPERHLVLTPGADDICRPCSHLIHGVCNDTIDTSWRPLISPSKYLWNLTIDWRWFHLLGLKPGDSLTVFEFCQLLEPHLNDLPVVYEELPAERLAQRFQYLKNGLKFVRDRYT